MEVKIEKLDDFGRGITYINNKICFVENALENELVEIEIIKETKKYYEAKVKTYLEINKKREPVTCPYYDTCGGCNLSHLNFIDENNFKVYKFKNLLKKFSNINDNLVQGIIYHDKKSYRNKITLHGKNKKLGLYKKETNEIIEINNCYLVSPKINSLIKLLNNINKNIKEAIIKVSNDDHYSMLKITGEVTDSEKLIKNVDVLIINDKVLTKNDKIITSIGTKNFFERSTSFFQINRTLTKELYDEVLKNVKTIYPKKVLDLYCGTGTIGIYISNYCKEIIGIDYNKSNIIDAKENKELNNISNINFICDKVENQITNFKNIDLIIVDPPRAGLDTKTKKNIINIKPKTLIYISCDPVTLIRDLEEMSINYNIELIKLFNMFPRTHHIESICVLHKNK